MGYTETLTDVAEPIWDAIEMHPMVAGLGNGTLDVDPFRYWVRQDYVYLVEYCRVFAYGAARAPDLATLRRFAELLYETAETEMALHREYAAEFGISEDALQATEASPTTRAYTDYLIRTAATGTFGDLVAALLPCMWGFNETAKRLEADGLPADERYAEWIRTYADDDFTDLTEWCKDLMDDVAAESSDAERKRYREIFETSARYEYRFWDAAWREEGWEA